MPPVLYQLPHAVVINPHKHSGLKQHVYSRRVLESSSLQWVDRAVLLPEALGKSRFPYLSSFQCWIHLLWILAHALVTLTSNSVFTDLPPILSLLPLSSL